MHKPAIFKKRALFSGLSLALLLSACGGDELGSSASANNTANNLSGTVTKGPVNGAQVYIYKINADGSRSAQPVAGPFMSNASGQWQGSVPEGVTGPFLLVASGGAYIDETSKQNIEIGTTEELTGVLEQANQTVAPITPYTHAVALVALQKARDGTAPDSAVQQAIAAAKTGLGFDPTQVIPPNPLSIPEHASANEKRYAAMLGGLTELAEDASYNGLQQKEKRFQLMLALSKDLIDGKLDGKDMQANAITLQEKALPAADETGLSKLRSKALAFAANNQGYQNLDIPSLAWEKPLYETPRHEISFQTVNKGAPSTNILASQGLEKHMVVSNASEWQSLWTKYQSTRIPPFPLPSVDFSKNYVLGVSMNANNGCHDIEIKAVRLLGNKLRVEYLQTSPTIEQLCTQSMVSPTHFVSVPKLANRVEFKDLSKKTNDDEADETFGIGESSYRVLPFQTLNRSNPSTNLFISLARHLWLADSSSWQTAWQKHQSTIMPTPALPTVDFSQQQVIGVKTDSGNGCSNIEIKEVRAVGSNLTVIYQRRVAQPGELCTQAMISPAHFIAVRKGASKVSFKDITSASADGAADETLNTPTQF